ncbi:hypothetical protein ACOSQ2_029924 [Xanthoceras sorbifolium]
MELKSTVASLFLLFLLLLSTPFSSKGGSVVAAVDSEVYEIDYRGPETHSSIPPPDHSRGKPMIHREGAMEPPKCKGLRGCNVAANGKKIHG